MKNMLVKVGWKKDMAEKQVHCLYISSWMDDNLLKDVDSKGKLIIGWWKGPMSRSAMRRFRVLLTCLQADSSKVFRVLGTPALQCRSAQHSSTGVLEYHDSSTLFRFQLSEDSQFGGNAQIPLAQHYESPSADVAGTGSLFRCQEAANS